MIRGIHHTAISTGDLERAIDFYVGLLGFEVINRFDWDQGTQWADSITDLQGSAARAAMLKLSNAFLEIFEYSSPPPRPADPQRPVCDHGITHIALLVSDLDAEYQRLKAAGMHFHCAPTGQLSAIYGRDPDGNVVELMEVAQSSPMALDFQDP
jgi:catechol 2,3-dioxygenase-like lactoylglutathione lyase family enzyme